MIEFEFVVSIKVFRLFKGKKGCKWEAEVRSVRYIGG